MRDKGRSEISDKEGLKLNSQCELKHLLISLFLFLLISPYLPPKISKFFDIYLSEISSYSVTSKKTDITVLMVCKVYSIFDEIFKICTQIKKWFANTVDSLYLELSRDREICSRQRKFEIQKILQNEQFSEDLTQYSIFERLESI